MYSRMFWIFCTSVFQGALDAQARSPCVLRSQEVVDAAIQEDAHAIALTSYQGGHMECAQGNTLQSAASATPECGGIGVKKSS